MVHAQVMRNSREWKGGEWARSIREYLPSRSLQRSILRFSMLSFRRHRRVTPSLLRDGACLPAICGQCLAGKGRPQGLNTGRAQEHHSRQIVRGTRVKDQSAIMLLAFRWRCCDQGGQHYHHFCLQAPLHLRKHHCKQPHMRLPQ